MLGGSSSCVPRTAHAAQTATAAAVIVVSLALLLNLPEIEARQWNNDVNGWTGENSLSLEGGLVVWGHADYGGQANDGSSEPIGYAVHAGNRLS